MIADSFQANQAKPNALAWALVKALWIPLLAPTWPKFALMGFSLAQPFLIQSAMVFIADPSIPDNYGHGLIAAYFLTYLGITVGSVMTIILIMLTWP